MLRLKRTALGNTKVVSLLCSQFIQHYTNFRKMQHGNFLVQVLRQNIYVLIVLGIVRPEFDLRQGLVCK